jgi:DNA-directed RNA polymerase specialized sigma24 family protein
MNATTFVDLDHNGLAHLLFMCPVQPSERMQWAADKVLTALQIRAALDRLSPQHRAVIELMYMYGCTAREAAGRLGIPEGTVFSRVYYAMRTLRQELGLTIGQSGAVDQAA